MCCPLPVVRCAVFGVVVGGVGVVVGGVFVVGTAALVVVVVGGVDCSLLMVARCLWSLVLLMLMMLVDVGGCCWWCVAVAVVGVAVVVGGGLVGVLVGCWCWLLSLLLLLLLLLSGVVCRGWMPAVCREVFVVWPPSLCSHCLQHDPSSVYQRG